MYSRPYFPKTSVIITNRLEGETIEMKMRRVLNNKEPLKDGAPIIYTERKDGVLPAYNVRTDRWEIAAEAMDKVTASRIAAKTLEGKGKETKEVNNDAKTGAENAKGESTQPST